MKRPVYHLSPVPVKSYLAALMILGMIQGLAHAAIPAGPDDSSADSSVVSQLQYDLSLLTLEKDLGEYHSLASRTSH